MVGGSLEKAELAIEAGKQSLGAYHYSHTDRSEVKIWVAAIDASTRVGMDYWYTIERGMMDNVLFGLSRPLKVGSSGGLVRRCARLTITIIAFGNTNPIRGGTVERHCQPEARGKHASRCRNDLTVVEGSLPENYHIHMSGHSMMACNLYSQKFIV